MKTQLKWRHRNIPYVCTYFTPGFLALGGTIFQHTVHDALRFFTSIALITCCAILISALYFTLPLSLAASHRTLHESSRTTIKLRIFCLVLSSLSFLLHSMHDYVLRSVFLLCIIWCLFGVLLRRKKAFTNEKSSTTTGLVFKRHQHGRKHGGREDMWKGFISFPQSTKIAIKRNLVCCLV